MNIYTDKKNITTSCESVLIDPNYDKKLYVYLTSC